MNFLIKNSISLHLIIFLIFISCAGKKQEGLAKVDMDGITFNIKTGGVAYDVINNKVDYEKGHHYVVTMNISNSSRNSLRFDKNSFKLINNSGQEIHLPINEDGLGIANKLFLENLIEINGTREVTLIFLINESQNNYRLKITSPLTQGSKLITL